MSDDEKPTYDELLTQRDAAEAQLIRYSALMTRFLGAVRDAAGEHMDAVKRIGDEDLDRMIKPFLVPSFELVQSEGASVILRQTGGEPKPVAVISACPSCGYDLQAPTVVKILNEPGAADPLGPGCVRPDGSDHTCGAWSLTADEDVLEVLRYVSMGRGYVDVKPYPDAAARRALGKLPESAP